MSDLTKSQRTMLRRLASADQSHLDERGFQERAHRHLAAVRARGVKFPPTKAKEQ